MKLIKEINTLFGTAYEVYLDNKLIKTVNFIRVNKEYKNFTYLFLIHNNGYVISDVYNFLNEEYKYHSINTREQMLSFLKLLYSFADIIGKPFELFDNKDIRLLSSFIQGENIQGNITSLELISKRSISTHNQYFNNMRSYFKYLGINNKFLFEKKNVSVQKSGFGMMAHTKTVTTKTYTTNKNRHSSFTVLVPKYIKLSEYHKIVEFINKQNKPYLLKLRNRLIIELMYGIGLRIGEVLGLTKEDLVVHPDNENYYKLILRNRLSDKPYQKAKTCHNVKSKNDYNSSDYTKKDTGYQVVIATKMIKDMIDEYIKLSTNIMKISDKVLSNIIESTVADCVTPERIINNYIFLNKNGTPLSSSGWNKELKFIFKSVGIKCDQKNKKDNLNHRFRHGFAMLLLKNKYPLYTIKTYLRHFNISSTLIYTKPTEDDILKQTEEIDNLRFSKKTTENYTLKQTEEIDYLRNI